MERVRDRRHPVPLLRGAGVHAAAPAPRCVSYVFTVACAAACRRVVSENNVFVLQPHEQTARQPDGTGKQRKRCTSFMAYLRGNAAGPEDAGGRMVITGSETGSRTRGSARAG